MKNKTHNSTPLPQAVTMDIAGAFAQMVAGRRVTKLDWADKRTYCVMKDNLFYLHKAGEAEEMLRPWIMSYGDAIGLDWIAIQEDNRVLPN